MGEIFVGQNFDKLLTIRVAKLYYIDGLSQQEIANRENIHRTQISRILKASKEMGIVKIEIDLPNTETADKLAVELREKLKLKEVLIAPNLSQTSDEGESIALYAARYLEENLKNAKNIGVGLGKTLYKVSSQLSYQNCESKPNFYSVVGSIGTGNSDLQNSVVLDKMATYFNGVCNYSNFMNYIRKNSLTDIELMRFDNIQEFYKKLDTVVLSLGGRWSPDTPYYEEIPVDHEILSRELAREHGDILGYVFFENGEIFELPKEYCITSINPNMLKNVENVICIANGDKKIWSIITAAKQKYIKTLITDENTANKILEYLQTS